MAAPARSFRLVCSASQIAAVESLLAEEGFRFEPEPFSPFCRKLLHAPFPLGGSLAAFFGYIYIQDRSSMLPPLALAPERGAAVLDMAASPGSKSGFLAQLTGEDGFVLANEPNSSRFRTLEANLERSALLQAGICQYPGEQLPLAAHHWEFILLDPPCSGWGTALKNPRALKLWQGKKIEPLIKLQRRLLRKASLLLTSGGRLLYSTCTLNPAENEAQTQFAINELGLQPVPIAPFPGFEFKPVPAGALLIDGARSGSQGFYLSLLTRAENAEPEELKAPDFEEIPPALLSGPVCDPSLLPPGKIAAFGEKVRFLPAQAQSKIPEGLKWQAFALGICRASNFTPDPRMRRLLPPLAVAPSAHRIIFDSAAPIRKLLKGEAVSTECQSPVAIWWRDLPLGICKVKNSRLIAHFH